MTHSDTLTSSDSRFQAVLQQSNLTATQLTLWLGQKLHADTPLYNMTLCFRIEAALDHDAFQRAFSALVDRSDAFNTVFTEVDGIPQRRQRPSTGAPLPIVDLSDAAQPEIAAHAWVKRASQCRFELHAKLFDSALICLGPSTYIWYLNQHHLIADAWSMTLAYRRVSEGYGELVRGQPMEPAAWPAFERYADQERRLRERGNTTPRAAYWDAKPTHSVNLYNAPFGADGSARPGARTERVSRTLSLTTMARLQQRAGEPLYRGLSAHTTVFNLLATALFAYLHRVSGQTGLSIGTPTHNRTTPDFRDTLGVFIDVLPLDIHIDPDDTFATLYRKVRSETANALKHAEPGLVSAARHRDLNVFLNYINAELSAFDGHPTSTTWVHSGFGDANHHLRLEVHDLDDTGRLSLDFDLNCDLFSERQRRWIPTHFCNLLEGVLDDPQQPIDAIPIVDADEKALLLTAFARADTVADSALWQPTIVEQFQTQVVAHPNRLAVCYADQSISYRDLDLRSNQIASYLMTRGIPGGSIVGVFLERSVDQVVAILGILKAGAAYLPFDPAYPKERTAFILADAQAPAIITVGALSDRLPRGSTDVIDLDVEHDAIARHATTAPRHRVMPNDLAYVLYTSGSTGQPKGVTVNHGNVMSLMGGLHTSIFADMDTREPLNIAWVAPVIFDISVKQIFSALLQGHTLYPAPDHTRFDGAALFGFLSQNRIDVTDGTPVHLKLLQPVVAEDPERFPVKHLIIAGDVLPRDVVTQFLNALPTPPDITNIYGVAECTVASTYYRIAASDLVGTDTLPIGKPLPDQHLYIVNEARQLQPLGVSGELCLGGDCVGNGYWQRPDLTEAAFIPDPFESERTVYRTGDMAQFRDDGHVVFLGRRNHQVKLRGYRIELQEVEFQLLRYRAPFSAYAKTVTDAAVTLRHAHTDRAALWGYVVADRPLAFKELRNHLRRHLPDYMIPTHFVQLDRLPLTPNGKIDRKALAETEADEIRPEAEPDFEAPTTSLQRTLVSIWQSVLRVEPIGLQDNFFDLGGDSIMAIQIAARLAEQGFEMTPNQVFQTPTLDDLAAVVQPTAPRATAEDTAEGAVPLSPIQHRFLTQHPGQADHYNQWCVLRMPADTCIDTLEAALGTLLAHHDAFRLHYEQTDAGWRQAYRDAPRPVAITRVDVSGHREEDRQRIVESTTASVQSELDLATGELVRAVVFTGDETDAVRLALVVHHLVVDGVSWLILLEDLDTLYRAARAGRAPSLPPKTASFKAWSEGMRHADIPAAERAYWRESSADVVPALPAFLASARQHPYTVAQLEHVDVTLTATETETLLHTVPQAYHTKTPDILLTALAQAWRDVTGQTTLRVDLEGHGREEGLVPGLSLLRSVGWFTSLFPVTLSVPTDDGPGATIGQIKDTLRRVPRNGIGYGILQRRDPESMPNPDTAAPLLFNYLGDLDRLLPGESRFRFDQALGLSRHPSQTLAHPIDVSGIVVDNQLEIRFRSPTELIGDVQRLADAFAHALRDLIVHCSEADVGGKTATDFELVQLDDQSFKKLRSLLSSADKAGGAST